jgi:gamma-glutamylcyclotransferase (GGCT)/AIG2-like uncharacterized protein YtfP
MTRFLTGNAEFIGGGVSRGRLYRIAHYPGLVASINPKDEVVGDVFRLRDPARMLKRLDIHEGCGPAAVRPTEYVREIVTVRLATGGDVEAWTYVYNWPVEPSSFIRSGDFLKG